MASAVTGLSAGSEAGASSLLDHHLAASLSVLEKACASASFRASLVAAADRVTDALRSGGKLLICGNGGSAADAQHIAGEFVSRLNFDRAPLAALALTVDTSVLTATANDYGYDLVFERQVLGLGRPGDVLLGISTSGRSPNVIRALSAATRIGLRTIGFGGEGETELSRSCEVMVAAPSCSTPLIQQIHIVAAHIVCGLVEEAMFGGPA